MADTGWKSPTATTDGTDPWANPTNAYSSDDNRASAYIAYPISARTQYYKTFALGVPAGATIIGIQVAVEGLTNSQYNVPSIAIYSASSGWADGISSGFTADESVHTLGGETNLWGETWVASDFSDANFNLYVSTGGIDYTTSYIDHIQVRVYYTPAPTTQTITETSRARLKQVGITVKETTRGRVKQAGLSKALQNRGRIKTLALTKLITARAKIKATLSKKVQSRGRIKIAGITTKETARGRVKTAGVTKKETTRARMKTTDLIRKMTSRARLKKTGVTKLSQSRGRVKFIGISKLETMRSRIKQFGNTSILQDRGRIKQTRTVYL